VAYRFARRPSGEGPLPLHGHERPLIPLLDNAGGALAVGGRALTYAGVALVCGGLVVGARAVRGSGDAAADDAHVSRAVVGAVWTGGVLSGLGAIVRVAAQVLAFAADGDSWGPIAWLVLQTTWGITAVAQMLAAATVCGGTVLAMRWSRPLDRLAETQLVYPALVLVVVPAFMGHAAADPFLAVGITLDALHVAGASVWVGGVALLARLAVVPSMQPRLGAVMTAFHADAVAAVTAVVVSGVGAAWRRVPDPAAIITTGWGRLLLAKVLLVLAVLALGWWNAYRGPGMMARGRDAAVRTALRMEWGLMTVVLLLTGLLAGTSPDP
jgi:putative copper export protein